MDEKIMEKLVSIVIPVYNSEKYVGSCIDSFLEQTYQNIELILIDDGSMDNSLEILKYYQEKYADKVFAYTQGNQGVAKTRNRGIIEAKGYYIMFADNDDYVQPDYVERMTEEIEKHNADMVVCSCRKVNENNETLYEQVLSQDEWSKFRMITPWARIIRREFLLDNQIEFGNFKVGEDSYFSVTAYNLSNKIVVIPYIGYNWVQHPTSVSNTIQKTRVASPFPFLEALIKRNQELVCISEDIFIYFIIKFVVWNLYYICDNLDVDSLKQCCIEYFGWLERIFPDYKKNPLLTFKTPRGEALSVRVLVCVLTKVPMSVRFVLLWMIRLVKGHVVMR